MTNKFILSSLVWISSGVAMPIFAGQAHPSGPENRPFVERTIAIHGESNNFFITLGYPTPDDVVDWTKQGAYNSNDNYKIPLLIHYDYKGHFWQGIFGGLTFEIMIKNNRHENNSWHDIDSLLNEIIIEKNENNLLTKNNRAEDRQEWMQPVKAELNGVQCVQQFVIWGNDPRGEWHYYFPFDKNHAIELKIALVNNSDRPGVPQSDWRSRAEVFAKKLLSSVKIVVKPNNVD